MCVELLPFAEAHAAKISKWPASVAEAIQWAGQATPFPVDSDQFREWHRDPDVRPFVGAWMGRIVAYGELWIDEGENEIELARIIVDPAHRGMGIGKGFVAALGTHAFALGVRNLYLRVVPSNQIAIFCYRAAGFEVVSPGEQKNFNLGQPVAYEWLKQSV